VDGAFTQMWREFQKAALYGYIEEIAEIGKPMTKVMQLIRKSDHTRIVRIENSERKDSGDFQGCITMRRG
jgi:hypothetical protein